MLKSVEIGLNPVACALPAAQETQVCAASRTGRSTLSAGYALWLCSSTTQPYLSITDEEAPPARLPPTPRNTTTYAAANGDQLFALGWDGGALDKGR
jgi:hypothetical protein